MRRVGKLKEFFKSCLALIHDRYVVTELTTLIEENPKDLRLEKRDIHVEKRLRTSHKMRMTMQIGDYDMYYIILDLS